VQCSRSSSASARRTPQRQPRQAKPWFYGIRLGAHVPQSSGLHPNIAGNRALAAIVEDAEGLDDGTSH
jgi:lysophospholipase L1-like esterase